MQTVDTSMFIEGVFKTSPDKCVKICAKQEYLVKAVDVLKIAQESSAITLGQIYINLEYLVGQLHSNI